MQKLQSNWLNFILCWRRCIQNPSDYAHEWQSETQSSARLVFMSLHQKRWLCLRWWLHSCIYIYLTWNSIEFQNKFISRKYLPMNAENVPFVFDGWCFSSQDSILSRCSVSSFLRFHANNNDYNLNTKDIYFIFELFW